MKISFLIKGFVNDPAEIESSFHQLTGNAHSFRRCRGILKYACIMSHTCINCFCYGTVYLFRIKKSVQDLAGRAYITSDMVDPGKTRITYVMINTCCISGCVKIRTCNGQPVSGTYITGNKQIILLTWLILRFYFIYAVNVPENRSGMIQVDIHLYFRIISFDI